MSNTKTTLDKQTSAAVQALAAYMEAIISAGPAGVPSGHLYALAAMPAGLDLETHNAIVATLRRAGMVQERGHVLTATAEARRAAGK